MCLYVVVIACIDKEIYTKLEPRSWYYLVNSIHAEGNISKQLIKMFSYFSKLWNSETEKKKKKKNQNKACPDESSP